MSKNQYWSILMKNTPTYDQYWSILIISIGVFFINIDQYWFFDIWSDFVQYWISTDQNYDVFISIDSVLIKADQLCCLSTLSPERLKCGKNWLQPRCQNFRLKDTILISILLNIVSDKTEIEAAFESAKSSEMFDLFFWIVQKIHWEIHVTTRYTVRWDACRTK